MTELPCFLPAEECHINTGVETVQPDTNLGQGAAHLFSIAIDVAFGVNAPVLVVGQDALLRHEDSEFAVHCYVSRLGARDGDARTMNILGLEIACFDTLRAKATQILAQN
jgi:hypothetical protein